MDVANKIALLMFIRQQVVPEKSNEGFTLMRSEKEKVASPLVQPFKADQPSTLQKERACLSMLNEARATIDALHGSLSVMATTGDIGADSMLVLTDRMDEASAKLAAVRDQCGDVLPAGAMEELGEMEKKLNEVRDLLGRKDTSGPDILEMVGSLLEALGNGAKTVAGIVAIMMRMIFGPGQPQTNGGGGLLVAQGENSEGTEPHRGSGRFGETSHRGSGRFEVAQGEGSEGTEPHRGSGRFGETSHRGSGRFEVAQGEGSEGTEPHRGSGRFGETSHRGSGRFEA
jgi:hypothetical protein